MRKVRVVPKKISGADDSVEMYVDCVTTDFSLGGDGLPEGIKSIRRGECRMMASVQQGSVSLSAREAGHMITVSIECLKMLLMEAEEQAKKGML